MRIFSKFHDYYDTAMGYGIDPTICYNRTTTEIVHKYMESGPFLPYTRHNSIELNGMLVGFCGVIYPVVEAKVYPYNKLLERHYCFDMQSVEDILASNGEKIEITKRNKWYYKESKYGFYPRFDKFFSENAKTSDEFFLQYDTPLFLIKKRNEGCISDNYNRISGESVLLTTNICLKDYQFFRIKDAFAAFQDISMYLSNVLVREHQPADIPDINKIQQHGFDKWSFRKEKE